MKIYILRTRIIKEKLTLRFLPKEDVDLRKLKKKESVEYLLTTRPYDRQTVTDDFSISEEIQVKAPDGQEIIIRSEEQ